MRLSIRCRSLFAAAASSSFLRFSRRRRSSSAADGFSPRFSLLLAGAPAPLGRAPPEGGLAVALAAGIRDYARAVETARRPPRASTSPSSR